MECGKDMKFSLENFRKGTEFKAYEFFGCRKTQNGVYSFRVWAPHAVKVELLGDFLNGGFAEMNSIGHGVFEIYSKAIVGDRYCYRIFTADKRTLLKADPYAYLSDLPNSFYSVVFDLPEHSDYPELFQENTGEEPINIYEVNLLSWKRHKDGSYLSYDELAKSLAPYVRSMGYTHVEFMPVTEFPYDGSWGYQVTGYFSVVSRLGDGLGFKRLVDAFHSLGVKVIVDWVPAHFPKDEWGLYEFDGQPLYECPLWDRMEHSGWGTRRFDFGRGEIDSFLLSSAYFLFDTYRIDGIRVDAVASMLYLDYDKNGDFEPNEFGDNRNLQAIEFLKKLNCTIKQNFKGAVTIAEESTTYPKLTQSVAKGGLGFDYKWNMGWMNDVLLYCRQDPYFRCWHHDKLTFSLVYAFSERYILPLSHDEVVHVKGSVINKMPGDYADKFAGERLLLAYMFAHPGKKLNFMGYEFAQFAEWDYRKGIDFFLKRDYEKHAKMFAFVKALNYFYRQNAPLYEIEDSWDGFKWLVVDDRASNLIAFNRYATDGESITCICNFSGIDISKYAVPAEEGKYRVAFNTDSKVFGGDGSLKKRVFKTEQSGKSGECFLNIDIPRLSCLYLKKVK